MTQLDLTTLTQLNPWRKVKGRKKREREGNGGQPKPTSAYSFYVGKSYIRCDIRLKTHLIYCHNPKFFILRFIGVGTHLNSHLTTHQYDAHTNSSNFQLKAYLKAMP
jgi:hypothetical protein